jgi:hypothetical protein
MSDAIVRENSLQFNGKNYFRVGSETEVIGSVGEKRSPITKGNYLEAKDRIKSAKLKIREIGPVKIDSQRTSKRDFLANVNLAKVFKVGSVDTAYEDVRDNKLDLLFFSVETNDMVKAINDSPAIRADLKRWGKDARVVTAGFVIVAAATSKTFASSTHVEAQLTAYGVTIDPKLGVSQGGSTAVEFPIGALFAYDISKIEWDNTNDTIVCDLKRDDHGL